MGDVELGSLSTACLMGKGLSTLEFLLETVFVEPFELLYSFGNIVGLRRTRF
jgi:hypothetical protein